MYWCAVCPSGAAGTMPTAIIGGNCHKYHFCHDKNIVATKTCLLRQNTSFVVIKVCLLQNIFVTKRLSGQAYFCRDKTFVATNVCHEKYLSRQKFCCNKHNFVMTNVLL